MKLALLAGLILVVIVLSGCAESEPKPTYNCPSESCSIEEMEEIQSNCENAIILYETTSQYYKIDVTRQGLTCHIFYDIIRSGPYGNGDMIGSSGEEGLSMICDIPLDKLHLLFDGRKSYRREALNYCRGSLKDYAMNPTG